MIKTLNVQVRHKTWPNDTPPVELLNLRGQQNIRVAEFLLMIGYCTVPAHAARHSINALWAWMRYFGALSPVADFRLSDDFAELDPHQKTILSDDFGMGMSLYLMASALGLQLLCDGKYFIDRLSTRVRCTVTASNAKNGSRKSPDFVGWDGTGRCHVIECKGTQSGSGYGNKQLKDGIPQKNAIRFADAIRGQSLVTGFEIARSFYQPLSRFVIRDPEPEVLPLDIEEDEVELAVETMARGKVARGLMLAGAPNLSRIVAAPFGDDPANLPDSLLFERGVERASGLRSAGLDDLERLTVSDGFLGREATIEFPFRIETPSGTFRKAFVRSEVAEDVLRSWEEEVRGEGEPEDRLDREQQNMAIGEMVTESDASGSELRDGKIYRSRIRFLE